MQAQQNREEEFNAIVRMELHERHRMRQTIAHRRMKGIASSIRKKTVMFKLFKRVKRTGFSHDFTEPSWGHAIGVDHLFGKGNRTNRIKGHGWGSDARPGFRLIPLGGSIPRVGDWIFLRSVTGLGYRYLLTKVEGCDNPRDMFFFEAKFDPEKN